LKEDTTEAQTVAGLDRPNIAVLPSVEAAAATVPALPRSGPPGALWVAVLLAVYGALQYRFVFDVSFVLDDYTILDKVGRATFESLWTAENPLWRWYRPWSRELHFWTLSRLFGPSEFPFRVASFALWAAVLVAYFTFVRRVQGASAAVVAALGAATLAAWGGTLGWSAGVQELWMLLFALIFLHATARRRGLAALLALAGALLSKETAAVLPAIALLYAIAIDRDRPGAALRRVAPQLVMVALWAVLHPFLRTRLAGPLEPPGSSAASPSPLEIALRTLLSVVNLEQWPAPDTGWLDAIVPALPSIALLAAGTAWALRRVGPPVPTAGRPAIFAIGWAVLAALPLFTPGLGWLSYYALLCALGLWAAMSGWLARRPWLAAGVVGLVAALQPVHAHTPSYEWGSDWFLRRTAYFVGGLEQQLKQRHPELRPHSRVYFANVPIGTGIGQPWFNPALRVWYRDSTLAGDFIRNYTSRGAGEPRDRDYFFHFDDRTHVWFEIVKGPEDIARERSLNPRWETDHGSLAILLGNAGDWRGAAEEIEKLRTVSPENPQYAFYLSICLGNLGDGLGMRRHRQLADSLRSARISEGAR
jgi:hypothetical protein